MGVAGQRLCRRSVADGFYCPGVVHGPLVRIPERVWSMEPPDPRPLGLLETLDPTEEGGLPRFLGRAWKYRKCIGERRAAKRFLGPYVPGIASGPSMEN